MKKIFLSVLAACLVLCAAVFTLTACGDSPVSFRLNFIADGEIVKTIDTAGNERISLPDNPTKNGYTFDGWFWDKDTWQKPFTANSLLDAPLSSDMSVYAKFTEKHEHNYTAVVTSPTCTERGYTTYTCECGNSYVADYTNARGHEFTNYFSNNDATYDHDGTKTARCNHGCGTTDTVPDIGSMLVEEKIVFKTLTVDENLNVYGKVPNTQTTFSFINEVTVFGNAAYVVSIDIYGMQQIPTKTVPLEIGDNTFYITETIGNDIKLYTVTLRRRPIYDVTFNRNGGTAVQTQYVEEDFYATEPSAPTRTGYTFDGWDYDFATPITGNTTINAQWVYYTVTTNRNDSNAGTVTTYNSTKVTVGDSVTITATTNSGYTFIGWFNGEEQVTNDLSYTFAMPSENATYTAKWTYYTLTTNTNDNNAGTVTSYNNTKVTVGDSVTITATTNSGYTFIGWFNGEERVTNDLSYTFTMQAEDMIYTAKWCKVVLSRNNTQAGSTTELSDKYVTGEEMAVTATTNIGYTWVGWYNGDEKLTDNLIYIFNMPSENVTYTAKWQVSTEMSNYDFTSTPTTCNITGIKDKTSTEIVVPYYVTNISSRAFYGCSSLKSIIIPDSVTSIGSSAFSNCTSLESITIPNSVTSIGSGAFAACRSLTSITIPDSVTSIGSSAFAGCRSLTSITIPFVGGSKTTTSASSSTLFGYIFGTVSYTGTTETNQHYSSGNNDYVTYYIPSSLRSVTVTGGNILRGAFQNCTSLMSITILDSVTSIGWGAFHVCTALTSVTIPDSVTSIGSVAFALCSSLTSITIPDSVTSIGEEAFSICSSLTSVTIPDSVTSIGYKAFSSCTSLTSITIPDSVTSIGNYAFYNCSSLTSITIPDSVTIIGRYAFDRCSSLRFVYYSGTAEDWSKISIGTNNSLLVYATRYYYSATEPVGDGNYWHYDSDGITPVVWVKEN